MAAVKNPRTMSSTQMRVRSDISGACDGGNLRANGRRNGGCEMTRGPERSSSRISIY